MRSRRNFVTGVAPALAVAAALVAGLTAPATADDAADDGAGDTAGDGAADTTADTTDAPAAAPAPEAYPPEALALLPKEMLDQLPSLVTRFLRAEHYVALREACPQPTPEGVVECLSTPAARELLKRLHAQGVIASMLERMDVELPGRLAASDFDRLAERCAAPGDVWGTCAHEHGVDADACDEREQALATCLVEGEDVVEVYLAIADEKKRVFGRALYAELVGLLAILPIDVAATARADCPQRETEAAVACLAQHPTIGPVIAEYARLARAVVEEAAQEAAAAGGTVDVDAYVEKVATLFLTLPSHTVKSLAMTCQKQYPELETTRSNADIDKALACIAEAAKTDPIANPAYISKDKLRSWVELARVKVGGLIRAKEERAQSDNFTRILVVLAIAAGVGFVVVLFMPLYLARRYPGQGARLWRASAVAAATFVVTVAVLGGTLLAIRTVQGSIAADSTSPKMRIADAAFAVLGESDAIDALSDLSKERLDFIKTPLYRIVKADAAGAAQYAVFAAVLVSHWADLLEEPQLQAVAKNAEMLKRHTRSLRAVFGVYERVDWVMGLVPIVLSLLAVILYVLPLRDTLVEIATAPAREAQGGAASRASIGMARHTIVAELKSVVPFIGLVLVLLPLTGLFLAYAVQPLVELLLGYSLLTVFYILLTEASAVVLYASLGSAMLMLVMALAVYIVTMALSLGKARKLFRAINHHGHRASEFRTFWIWGPIAAIWLLALPLGYAYGVLGLTELVEPRVESLGATDLLLVPLPAVLLFPVVFWALRGWKALTFLRTFR